jgi:hypothetical protein
MQKAINWRLQVYQRLCGEAAWVVCISNRFCRAAIRSLKHGIPPAVECHVSGEYTIHICQMQMCRLHLIVNWAVLFEYLYYTVGNSKQLIEQEIGIIVK